MHFFVVVVVVAEKYRLSGVVVVLVDIKYHVFVSIPIYGMAKMCFSCDYTDSNSVVMDVVFFFFSFIVIEHNKHVRIEYSKYQSLFVYYIFYHFGSEQMLKKKMSHINK